MNQDNTPTRILVSTLSDVHIDVQQMCRTANELQSRYYLSTDTEQHEITAVLTDVNIDRLFALRGNIVQVSTLGIGGICTFARLVPEELLAISILLGAIEHRALALNEMLDESSLDIGPHGDCLWGYFDTPEELTDILETFHVCNRCAEFYRALGVELDVHVLAEFTAKVRAERKGRSIARWHDMGEKRLPTEIRLKYRKQR